MTFEEAEAKFRQLQTRVQRGEAISRAEYEDQVSMLSVTDDNGVLWEINPRTGKWMYFDGAEWVSGSPPGHDTSSVIPAIGTVGAPPLTQTPPPTPTTPRPMSSAPAPVPASQAGRSAPPPPAPESTQPARRAGANKPIGTPPGAPAPTRPVGANRFAGREWIPLAIGAVVLLFCAVALLASYTFIAPMFAPAKTPTRVAAPTIANSPVPTVVRLPSPTPLPPTPAPVIAQVAGDYANVRSRASTSGTIVTRLQKAAQVTLIAVGPKDGANVWYQINVPDKPEPGWVRSDTIKIISGDPATLPPAGGTAPAATKPAAPPAATKAPAVTPTPTVIGVIAPTPKVYP
jgi:hypothetical protein